MKVREYVGALMIRLAVACADLGERLIGDQDSPPDVSPEEDEYTPPPNPLTPEAAAMLATTPVRRVPPPPAQPLQGSIAARRAARSF